MKWKLSFKKCGKNFMSHKSKWKTKRSLRKSGNHLRLSNGRKNQSQLKQKLNQRNAGDVKRTSIQIFVTYLKKLSVNGYVIEERKTDLSSVTTKYCSSRNASTPLMMMVVVQLELKSCKSLSQVLDLQILLKKFRLQLMLQMKMDPV